MKLKQQIFIELQILFKKNYLFQGMTSHPPRDLTSLLVEVRVPDDVEKCFWAKKFREHLGTIGRSDLEAMLDFVIVCNVLRNKESEVKNCRNMKWRLADLNKERRGGQFYQHIFNCQLLCTNILNFNSTDMQNAV